jgi:hypothetical protein
MGITVPMMRLVTKLTTHPALILGSIAFKFHCIGSMLVHNDRSKFHHSKGMTSKLKPVVLFCASDSVMGPGSLIPHCICFPCHAVFVITLLSDWFVIVIVLHAPNVNDHIGLDRYTSCDHAVGGVRVQRINPALILFSATSVVPLLAMVRFIAGVENCAAVVFPLLSTMSVICKSIAARVLPMPTNNANAIHTIFLYDMLFLR